MIRTCGFFLHDDPVSVCEVKMQWSGDGPRVWGTCAVAANFRGRCPHAHYVLATVLKTGHYTAELDGVFEPDLMSAVIADEYLYRELLLHRGKVEVL